jgi:tight adherence protein C
MSVFSNFYAMLEQQFGALTQLVLIGVLGLVVVMAALPFLLVKPAEPFDKVKSQRMGKDARDGRAKTHEAQLRREEKADNLQKFASFLEPQNSGDMDAARLQLLRAGYRGKNAVSIYNSLQLACGVGGLALGAGYLFFLSFQGDVATLDFVIYLLGAGAVGFYLPKLAVVRALQQRQTQILEGFPDALDLMLVSVEAGQSLDQSINRIAREARASYPALADEFEIVAQEVKAGKERSMVLKDMAHRINVPDITSFVSTLVQSAAFGTSMAEALRMYSAEMRDKRAMRAEEKANTIPTKLTLATMMFTLPPTLTILMGPMVVDIIK